MNHEEYEEYEDEEDEEEQYCEICDAPLMGGSECYSCSWLEFIEIFIFNKTNDLFNIMGLIRNAQIETYKNHIVMI